MIVKHKKYNLPAGYSLIQTALKSNEFLRDPIRFVTKSMENFSGTYTANLGVNRKLILTQDPGFINYILKENHKNYKKSELSTESAVKLFGNGLLFSNGDYWLRQRRLIQPAFHKQRIQGLYDIVIKSVNDFLPSFPTGESIDIYPLINRLSFNILIKSIFDINISSPVMDELSRIFSDLQDFLIKDINQPLRRLFYPLTGAQSVTLKKAKRLKEIFGAIISQRKSGNGQYADLLEMLLTSKYEDTGEAMTEAQILDEVLIIIFAGHETTANTLSWLLYLLASHPAVCKKLTDLFSEITIGECLNNEYLKATINEAMRLYPAAWMTERVAIEEDEFGKFSFPKNTIIIPFFFGLHRDKGLWQDALAFKPERFIDDAKSAKPKNYFPFGAGPRMCIGNNFALMEMSFFLYTFLKEFQIKPTGQIPAMKALITLRPGKVILGIKK
jgi:cytochrome P450